MNTNSFDVNSRDVSEQSLLADVGKLLSQEDLHALLDRADEGFALIDPVSGRYLYLSESGHRLLDCIGDDQIGQRAPWLIRERDAVMHMKFGGREFSYRVVSVNSMAIEAAAVQFRDVTGERRRERQLRAFSVAAASSAFATTLSSVLNGLAEQVRRTARMGSCTFLLYDDQAHPHQSGTAGLYPRSPDYTDRLLQCRQLGAPLLSDDVVRTRQLRIEPGWRQRTLSDPRFAPIHEMSEAADWDTILVMPLQVRGKIVGVFNGFYPAGGGPDPEDISFLASIADHAAVAVDTFNARAALEDQIARTERARLARDLHDTVSQLLYAVTTHAAALEIEASSRSGPGVLEEHIRQLRSLSAEAFGSMRALLDGARELAQSGVLSDAIQRHLLLAKAQGCSVSLNVDPQIPALPAHIEEQLLRVVQESVNNVIRHAPGAHVEVSVRNEGGGIEVEVSDNGSGFDVASPGLRWLGLEGMRDRMRLVNGAVAIRSSSIGTTVLASVPGSAPQ